MVTSRSLPTGGSEAHHTAREGPHGVVLVVRGVDRARTKPKPKTRAKGRGPRKILAPSKMVSGGGPVARQGQALRVPWRVPLTRSFRGRSRRSRAGTGENPCATSDPRAWSIWSGLTKHQKSTIMVPQRAGRRSKKREGSGNMVSTMKIRLVGGFHSVPETMLVLKGERWEGESIHDAIARLASARQLSRLNGHFCGVSGCTCGSWCRAAAEEV